MMSNFDEIEVKDQQALKGVDLTPPGELILVELGIEPASVKSIKPSRRTHYIAVINWLTEYKPQPDASNLEKVRGYLEAFQHLCEVQAWEAAIKILFTRLNTPTYEELHEQLNTWGYYRVQADLYNRLLNKLSPSLDAIFFLVWAMLTMPWETISNPLSTISRA